MAHLRKHEAKQARCLLEPTISQRPTQELSENVRKLCKSSKDAVQRYDWNKPKDCDTTQIFTVSCASVNEEAELKLLQLSQNRYLHCQLRKCWWRRKIASATTLPKSIQKWEPNTENLSQQNVSQQQLGSSFCLAQVFWLKFCLGSPAGLDWIRVWARLLGRCFFWLKLSQVFSCKQYLFALWFHPGHCLTHCLTHNPHGRIRWLCTKFHFQELERVEVNKDAEFASVAAGWNGAITSPASGKILPPWLKKNHEAIMLLDLLLMLLFH